MLRAWMWPIRPAPMTAMLIIASPSPSLLLRGTIATRTAAWQEGEMATIRLTMAQALVRYLAAQRTECDGRTVPLFGGVWAIFGHGNVAGIGEALAAHRDRSADVSRAQRAGDGAGRDRLRQGDAPAAHDGLHHLDRPGRHQHGHRRRGGACRSAAGAAAAGRRVRLAPARSGAAAGRELSATARYRPTTASARCRATSIASRGRSRSSQRCRARCRC